MRKQTVRDRLITTAGLTFVAAVAVQPLAVACDAVNQSGKNQASTGRSGVVLTNSEVLIQRGQGPRGGFGGMRMRGGAMLLMRPDVQQELKLTEEQQQQLRQAMAPPGGGRGGFGGGQRPDPAAREAREREMDAKIKTVLNDGQYTRYHELSVQMEGPPALVRPMVAEKVGLSAQQRDQIQTILQSSAAGQRGQFQQRGQGERPSPEQLQQLRQQMEAARTETNNKIVAVLTDEQKQKWQSLQGSPFTFEPMGFGRRGGGQGRPLRNQRRPAPNSDAGAA